MLKFNPFRPGSIVNASMFAGRMEELTKLEQALFQTKNGNPHHFLLHGERGIGKSSLLFYLQCIAKGEIESLEDNQYHFLVVQVELEPSNDYSDLIKKVGSGLKRAVEAEEKIKLLAKNAWNFLVRWEVMGVRYNKKEVTQIASHELLEDLVYTFEQTVNSIKDEFDGVLVLIDEADKAPSSANLGEFVKLLTERLSKHGCDRVMLGVSGQSSVLEKMRESHESSLRIFEILNIQPLDTNDSVSVIEKGIEEANAKNLENTTVTKEATGLIAYLSEGYPHFIQQYAYSSLEEDQDNVIDEKDVVAGAFSEHGAVSQLGQKYFNELFFDQINSDEYRQVLRVLAENRDNWTTKTQVRAATGLKESTLRNAISALTKRNIIATKPGTKGSYRLPTKSFAVWIKAYTSQDKTKTGEANIAE